MQTNNTDKRAIILSGGEIAELIKSTFKDKSGEQEQPAGFDLTVSKVYSFQKTQYSLETSKTENSELVELPAPEDWFDLSEGAYVAELNEITTIPGDAIGILFPRSTLLRNGLDLRTALFDPGYSGQPKVLLVCYRPAKIKRFARVGQLVIIRSNKEFERQYAGRYQGERELSNSLSSA
jgi:dUTP pyrophosphatase